MANVKRADSPAHLAAIRRSSPAINDDAEWMNRADGAHGLCVSMPWAVGPGWYEPGLWPFISRPSVVVWESKHSLRPAGTLRLGA